MLLLVKIIFSERESLLQAVRSGKGGNLFVLEPSNNNAGSYSYLFCEFLEYRFVESISLNEGLIFSWRNKKILGKPIRLLFLQKLPLLLR